MGGVVAENVNFWFTWSKHGLPPQYAHGSATAARVAARAAARNDPGHKYIVGHAIWKFGVDAETAPEPGETGPRPIQYAYGRGGRISLPQGAPFDGDPVLIRLAQGWVEAWWAPAEGSGEDAAGFCWVALDDRFEADLDEAKEWMPLPISIAPPAVAPELEAA